MNNARVERMIRELQAEPAEQFVESVMKLAGWLRPRLAQVRRAPIAPQVPARA
jgi:hypothetical protein